jgi:hypothetical protein
VRVESTPLYHKPPIPEVPVYLWGRCRSFCASFVASTAQLKVQTTALEFRFNPWERSACCSATQVVYKESRSTLGLSVGCDRFLLKHECPRSEDLLQLSSPSLKLELFSLGVDRLNQLDARGVPASADAVLKPLDVCVVGHAAADAATMDSRGIGHAPVNTNQSVRVSGRSSYRERTILCCCCVLFF